MTRAKARTSATRIRDLMSEKSRVLTKAQALTDMGLNGTAQPLWLSVAALEEQIAPLMEALGRDAEAVIHRVSGASCYQKVGELGRAANLFRAALAGPLPAERQKEVRKMLAGCLRALKRTAVEPVA